MFKLEPGEFEPTPTQGSATWERSHHNGQERSLPLCRGDSPGSGGSEWVKNKPNGRKWELQGQGKKGNCNLFFFSFFLNLKG